MKYIFTGQLGILAVLMRGIDVPPRPPPPFLQQASGQIFKDDKNGFSSISDICFMGGPVFTCAVLVFLTEHALYVV